VGQQVAHEILQARIGKGDILAFRDCGDQPDQCAAGAPSGQAVIETSSILAR
jgi:hypothetical protein